jgi:hypothetical protein
VAKVTNVGSRRFYSRGNGGFRLLPSESLEVTTEHALAYLGRDELQVDFDTKDSLDGISELRLLNLNRVLGLDLDTKGLKKHLLPKKKAKSGFPKKKALTPKSEEKADDGE